MSLSIIREACPCCGGQLNFLGYLGDRTWFRCADCGSETMKSEEEE